MRITRAAEYSTSAALGLYAAQPIFAPAAQSSTVSVSKMSKKNDIGSWYLADVVQRSEAVGAKKSNPNRRCLTWVNTLLIRAPSLSAAYDKAMMIAKRQYSSRYKAVSGRTVQWTALGISSLVPIYESLDDGSEIAWTDRGYLSAKRSEGMVASKMTLSRTR
jgi:hypothetical protein